jgi:hypothetical protein
MRESIRFWSLGLFGGSAFQSLNGSFSSARHHHNDRPQRVQDLDRTVMRGEHVGNRR